ncbi:CBS and ACT domain-containing protein [Agrilactobacillus fermenti]|uniref:CBS and ACT domain-containing protein n=1 Tax=Agrilactobacillus fermenti TaxID=2586909 RepID=UPI001E312F27|nr:CBS and ACT domain-containing protein [Agrilactobacillus fermenti]MCD2257180.1 CBS domain-containing protein [Agrilactobacillus fermenti]
MSVSDFMTKDLVTVTPDVRINDAVDLMKDHNIHRLPVVDNGRLVGLVTQGIIEAAMPSKATSLSVYEVNYLLNKTTVQDVMEKSVLTIAPGALLEDAVYKMRHYNIGVLPVLSDADKLEGIITNNDIFNAFLDISGYSLGGTRVSVKINQDEVGFLAKVGDALAQHHYNILTLVVNRRPTEKIVQMHIDTTDSEGVQAALEAAGFEVVQAELSDAPR